MTAGREAPAQRFTIADLRMMGEGFSPVRGCQGEPFFARGIQKRFLVLEWAASDHPGDPALRAAAPAQQLAGFRWCGEIKDAPGFHEHAAG